MRNGLNCVGSCNGGPLQEHWETCVDTCRLIRRALMVRGFLRVPEGQGCYPNHLLPPPNSTLRADTMGTSVRFLLAVTSPVVTGRSSCGRLADRTEWERGPRRMQCQVRGPVPDGRAPRGRAETIKSRSNYGVNKKRIETSLFLLLFAALQPGTCSWDVPRHSRISTRTRVRAFLRKILLVTARSGLSPFSRSFPARRPEKRNTPSSVINRPSSLLFMQCHNLFLDVLSLASNRLLVQNMQVHNYRSATCTSTDFS